MFEIRKRLCDLCLIGKIVPEHCTIISKAALQKICYFTSVCRHFRCVKESRGHQQANRGICLSLIFRFFFAVGESNSFNK